VNALQSYLIQQDKGPAAQRLKIHGATDYFGILTYNALVEFQASVGIHASGYFGPITRAWVTKHGLQ
jgi:peptidoglycan hydrolase-like protein with peptidoglycan-binding domain